MWEEGVRIYGTPGVPNNFPSWWTLIYCFFLWEEKKKISQNKLREHHEALEENPPSTLNNC